MILSCPSLTGSGIALVLLASCFAQAPLRLERAIALPGVEGRIDHLAADVAGQRLFVAALGNNTLEVLDLRAGARLRSLGGLSEPQGVAYVADRDRVYVANGQSGKLEVFDGKTLQPAASIPFGDDADNVRYEPEERRVWVGYGSGALAAMNIASNQKAGEVKLDEHPESFQLEKGGSRIFVNVPKAGHIAVIDRNKLAVIAKWPVRTAASNYPLTLDAANHRLFTGCRKPARILVFDTQSGKLVTDFDCVGDTDDIFFDAARKRLYVIGGEGFIDVFAQKDADQYARIDRIRTAPGARTGLFVPDLNRLFLAVPHRGAQGTEIRVFVAEATP
jgi:DNA-binding beta-propeller fold protein YncE